MAIAVPMRYLPATLAIRTFKTASFMSREKFYITTPIFYPNGKPHIGHAYTVIATDALARFQRLDGKDVFFLTGTDEHGLKMQQTADQEGITAQALADRNSAVFRAMVEAVGGSNDEFIRTTEERHYKACQAIWERMAANGDIYLDRYSGWYSVRQEAYFDEKETTVGDDGVRREPLGSPVEWNEEETYFFRLSVYQHRLLALYESNPEFVGPSERRRWWRAAAARCRMTSTCRTARRSRHTLGFRTPRHRKRSR